MLRGAESVDSCGLMDVIYFHVCMLSEPTINEVRHRGDCDILLGIGDSDAPAFTFNYISNTL